MLSNKALPWALTSTASRRGGKTVMSSSSDFPDDEQIGRIKAAIDSDLSFAQRAGMGLSAIYN